jgi:hypothetical protein
MFEKEARGVAIAGVPIEPGNILSIGTREVRRSAIGESIDHALRASALVVVDLRQWSLHESVMIERLQTTKELLTAPANERGELMRTQKAVSLHKSKNLHIARSEFHRREISYPLKARVSKGCHAFILPDEAWCRQIGAPMPNKFVSCDSTHGDKKAGRDFSPAR